MTNKNDIQFIGKDGKDMFAILPIDEYRRLIEKAGEEDGGTDQDMTYPDHVVRRIAIDDENPVKVLREWRGKTQEDLAKDANLSTNYISMIETGRRALSKKTAVSFADILNVDWDMLLDEDIDQEDLHAS